MKEQVEAVIDQIRPILQSDGGDIQLIGVDEKTGIVTVGLRGRCGGCPAAQRGTGGRGARTGRGPAGNSGKV